MKFLLEQETISWKYITVFFLALFTLSTGEVLAQNDGCYPPKPNRMVVDAANILTSQEEALLEQKLQRLDRETSNQIVIVTLEELCAGDAAMTAYEIGERWQVGQKDFDNGVVILVKPTGGPGQRKTFIATGYGLEGAIPDATAKLIVDQEMIPAFKGQNYFAGLDKAVVVLSDLATGEYNYKDYGKKSNRGKALSLLPILFFVIIWLLLTVKRTRSYAHGNNLGFWAALMLLNSSHNRHRGSYGNFSSGGGSFGGFGGFGGGSFGGGGAGGSW